MDTETMGRVTTEVSIENISDLWDAEQGKLPKDQVRRLELIDALVDTGATLVSMPRAMIEQLGLRRFATKRVRGSTGKGEAGLFGPARLTIQGRICSIDILEVPDDIPVLIGHIPLEHLDFVVDMHQRKLIGNPAHGGEHVYEMY